MEGLLDMVDNKNRNFLLGLEDSLPTQHALPIRELIGKLREQIMPFATPYWVSTQPSESVTANSTKLVTLRIPADMVFVWTKLVCSPSQTTLSLIVRNPASGIQYMRAAVPYAAITGNGQRPYRLTVPSIFQPGSDIILELSNTGGSDLTPNVTLIGHAIHISRVPMKLREMLVRPELMLAYHYWFVTDTFPISVTTTRTEFPMSVFRTGDFIGEQLLVNYDNDFNLSMRETGSGREVIRNGVASAIFGNGQYNPLLPYPLFAARGEELIWTCWTTSGTASASIIVGGIFVPVELTSYYARTKI